MKPARRYLLHRLTRYSLAALFTMAGVLHFVYPDSYAAVVPPYLPAPRLLVLLSGVAEIAGGMGLLVARLRRYAACGLVLMLVVFLLAHVHMALRPDVLSAAVPAWALWLRIPLQFGLIAAVWWAATDRPSRA